MNNRRLRRTSFDELINLYITVSYVSKRNDYVVVKVRDDQEAYRNLTKAYLEWVHDPNCDTSYNKIVQIGNERRHVTFMRDDSIGDRSPAEDDGIPHVQEISSPEGTDVFFPVYYFHSSVGESDGEGGKCEDIERCKEVAKIDLDKIKEDNGKKKIWAIISADGKVGEHITSNFDDHNVTESYTYGNGINVVVDSRLNREPDFHLNRGTYDGVVDGTFMYLRNFKKGEYILYFGGEATNFITRSVYKMHII